MWHARDPTGEHSERQTTHHTQAIVTAQLAASQSAGDCGAALAADVALTMMETGEVTRGRAAVVALLDYLHQQAYVAPPSIAALVAGADRAMIEAEFAGIHASEFAAIAATGRQVRVPYVAAYDLDAGTISAVRLDLPMDAPVRQLGDQ